MNGAVLPVLALYIVAAEEQGVPPEKLAGTIQNDILKEFMVRNTYIYPPAPSLRIISDIFAYTSAHMPKFNSISISGYHMQEAGATQDLELAYTLADGVEYVRAGIKAGLDIDRFAPRLSFFWAIGMNFFMEVAKLRAARLLWAKLMKEFDAEGPALAVAAHALPDLGLVARPRRTCSTTWRAPRSRRWRRRRATPSRCTPTRSTRRWRCRPISPPASRATPRSFLQQESGTTRIADPWGGSFYVERLTAELAKKAWGHIQEVEELGGMAKAIEAGIPKLRIEEAAAKTQARIDAGPQSVIGVNKYRPDDETPIDVLKVDNSAVRSCSSTSSRGSRRERDPKAVEDALAALTRAADGGNGNLLALAVDAARAKATVGEISSALEKVFGRHRAEIKSIVRRLQAGGRHDRRRRARAEARRRVRGRTKGRRPRILVAKIGQDGHDRGQKVIASAFADLGFDVDIGPLFATPARGRAPGGRERRAHPRRVVARRRASDAGAGAQGRAREAGPRRHHDRGRRRGAAAGLRRAQEGRRRGDLPARHGDRRGRRGAGQDAQPAARARARGGGVAQKLLSLAIIAAHAVESERRIFHATHRGRSRAGDGYAALRLLWLRPADVRAGKRRAGA